MPSPLLDAPEAIPQAFSDAWNARNADALADLFEADAEFVNVVGLWWHDREAIRTAHAYGLKVIFPDSTLRVIHTRHKSLAPDIELVHAVFGLVGQTAHGSTRQLDERRTVMSFVMRKGASGWRCAAAHNTDVVSGAETHIREKDGALRPADYRT